MSKILIRDELGINFLMPINHCKIEKEFDIEIEESFLMDIETVGSFVRIIEQKPKRM